MEFKLHIVKEEAVKTHFKIKEKEEELMERHRILGSAISHIMSYCDFDNEAIEPLVKSHCYDIETLQEEIKQLENKKSFLSQVYKDLKKSEAE